MVGELSWGRLPCLFLVLPDPMLFFVFQLLFLAQSLGTPYLDTLLGVDQAA